MATTEQQPTSQEAADAARWEAFRAACATPWEKLSPAWQNFFYTMGNVINPVSLDDAIDAVVKGESC